MPEMSNIATTRKKPAAGPATQITASTSMQKPRAAAFRANLGTYCNIPGQRNTAGYIPHSHRARTPMSPGTGMNRGIGEDRAWPGTRLRPIPPEPATDSEFLPARALASQTPTGTQLPWLRQARLSTSLPAASQRVKGR
jgi:hypothetical protein